LGGFDWELFEVDRAQVGFGRVLVDSDPAFLAFLAFLECPASLASLAFLECPASLAFLECPAFLVERALFALAQATICTMLKTGIAN